MYSGRQSNRTCKFIAIFILNRLGRGGYNCLSSTVSTSKEKSLRNEHRISFEDTYSCSIYCVDIKVSSTVCEKSAYSVDMGGCFVSLSLLVPIESVDLEWFWNIPFSDVNGELICISISDAWNDMEWNWSFRVNFYNSIQNSATELVYAYLPTHMWSHISHGSKVKHATKKM